MKKVNDKAEGLEAYNIEKSMIELKINNQIIFIPLVYENLLNKKINSLNKMYNNIEKIILLKGEK